MDATVPTIEVLDLAVHRIRRVAPPEAPYPATRATVGGEETVLLVDTDALQGWRGWRCRGTQHLLAPLDIVRCDDGHEAVFPDLREPVSRACGEREAAGVGWRRGEAVTLLVSLVRGVAEAAAIDAVEGPGEWWIAADGRPMFVFVDGAGDTVVSAARIFVDRVAAQIDDRVLVRAIDDVRAGLDRPEALARRLDDLEEPLFDAAAPQPIEREARPAGEGRTGRAIGFDAEDADVSGSWLRDALDRHIDSSLGELLHDAFTSVTDRLASRRARRASRTRPRRPRRNGGARAEKGARWPLAVVGSAVVAVVVGAGMLWPAGAPDARAREEGPAPVAPTQAVPSPTAEPEPDVDDAHGDDPLRAADALLAAWDACGEACGAPDHVGRAGAAAHEARALRLIDDYGAVALIEVTAPDTRAQLLVVELVGEVWRIRDLYDAPE